MSLDMKVRKPDQRIKPMKNSRSKSHKFNDVISALDMVFRAIRYNPFPLDLDPAEGRSSVEKSPRQREFESDRFQRHYYP